MARTLMSNNSNSQSGFLMGTNPVIRRLGKVEETDSSNACSYAGIGMKLLYFMVMILAGVVLNAVMAGRWGGEVFKLDSPAIVMTSNESIAIIVAALLLVISPILATFIRITIPVTGALFCASTGFLVSWAGSAFGKDYASSLWLAMIITALLVVVMGFLYFTGKVQVTKKFRMVLIVLILCSVLSGIFGFIGYLIPFTRPFVVKLWGNAFINIAGSVLLVVIGTLFLLVDFDTVRRSVDEGLPRKYEWSAAFGLAFSVIWLFFKVLELISKVKGNKSN